MCRVTGYIWQFSVLSAPICYEFRAALKRLLKSEGDTRMGEKLQKYDGVIS